MTSRSSFVSTVPPAYLAAFVTLIVGVIGVLYFVGQIQRAKQTAWTPTTAQVTEIGWQTYRKGVWQGTNHKGAFSRKFRYVPTLRYSYTVAGVTHEKREEFKRHTAKTWQELSGPGGFHAQHPVGSPIGIRYDPRNPKDSVTYPTAN
jgi:hypothetical protein